MKRIFEELYNTPEERPEQLNKSQYTELLNRGKEISSIPLSNLLNRIAQNDWTSFFTEINPFLPNVAEDTSYIDKIDIKINLLKERLKKETIDIDTLVDNKGQKILDYSNSLINGQNNQMNLAMEIEPSDTINLERKLFTPKADVRWSTYSQRHGLQKTQYIAQALCDSNYRNGLTAEQIQFLDIQAYVNYRILYNSRFLDKDKHANYVKMQKNLKEKFKLLKENPEALTTQRKITEQEFEHMKGQIFKREAPFMSFSEEEKEFLTFYINIFYQAKQVIKELEGNVGTSQISEKESAFDILELESIKVMYRSFKSHGVKNYLKETNSEEEDNPEQAEDDLASEHFPENNPTEEPSRNKNNASISFVAKAQQIADRIKNIDHLIEETRKLDKKNEINLVIEILKILEKNDILTLATIVEDINLILDLSKTKENYNLIAAITEILAERNNIGGLTLNRLLQTKFNGKVLLNELIKISDKKYLELLLDKIDNINSELFIDVEGATPLHTAFEYRSTDIIQRIIELGADLTSANKDGLTPWQMIGLDPKIIHIKLENSPSSLTEQQGINMLLGAAREISVPLQSDDSSRLNNLLEAAKNIHSEEKKQQKNSKPLYYDLITAVPVYEEVTNKEENGENNSLIKVGGSIGKPVSSSAISKPSIGFLRDTTPKNYGYTKPTSSASGSASRLSFLRPYKPPTSGNTKYPSNNHKPSVKIISHEVLQDLHNRDNPQKVKKPTLLNTKKTETPKNLIKFNPEKIDFSYSNKRGENILHTIIRSNIDENAAPIINALISKVKFHFRNRVNEDGKTILHYALEKQMYITAKIIIEKGINLTLKDKFGKTAFDYIDRNSFNKKDLNEAEAYFRDFDELNTIRELDVHNIINAIEDIGEKIEAHSLLRPYQKDFLKILAKKIEENYHLLISPAPSSSLEPQKSHVASFTFNCDQATGTGKTEEFMSLIKFFGLKATIIVPTIILAEQTYQRLKTFIPSAKIVQFKPNTILEKDYDINVVVYNSFENNLKSFMHSQLLIFDEAHMYLSECRSSIIDYLTSKLDRIIVGFTATQQFSTTRAKKARSSVDQVFNPPIFRYTIDQGVKDGFLHPVRVENIDFPSFKDAVKIKYKKKSNLDSENDNNHEFYSTLLKENLELIANLIIEKSAEFKSVLIYLPEIEIGKSLADTLNKRKPNSARSISGYDQYDHIENTIKAHKEQKFQFLLNVKILIAGYNDPNLMTIFNFCPTYSTTDVMQIFGRLTRNTDNNDKTIKVYYQLVLPNLKHVVVRVNTEKSEYTLVHSDSLGNQIIEEPEEMDVQIVEGDNPSYSDNENEYQKSSPVIKEDNDQMVYYLREEINTEAILTDILKNNLLDSFTTTKPEDFSFMFKNKPLNFSKIEDFSLLNNNSSEVLDITPERLNINSLDLQALNDLFNIPEIKSLFFSIGQFNYDKINQLVKIVGLPIKVIYKYLSPDGRIDQYIKVFGENDHSSPIVLISDKNGFRCQSITEELDELISTLPYNPVETFPQEPFYVGSVTEINDQDYLSYSGALSFISILASTF